MTKNILLHTALFIILAITLASADILSDKISLEYPREKYLVGIGMLEKTDNPLRDRRVAEVLARSEIAKQIKVHLREVSYDFSCEGPTGKLFSNTDECRNEFILTLEETVDEVIVGSRIVSYVEKDKTAYAVAVLPRETTVKHLNELTEDSIKKTKESIKKAKEGNKDSVELAKDEFLKALAFDKEKEMIEGVKGNSDGVFEGLEKEILNLK